MSIEYDDSICDLFLKYATESADGDVRHSVHEVYRENLINDPTVSADTSFRAVQMCL